MRLILGSQSPRRRKILSYFSLPFEQVSSDFDETSISFKGNPEIYVQEIAKGKAKRLIEQFPEVAILTADTIVYRHGKIYGKPSNESEAMMTLTELAGQWHSVFTAVVLCFQGKLNACTEETRVLFNDLTPKQIQTYHQKLNLYDKAGSYQLQMPGGLAISKIDGCYYNVVGLPINSVRSLLLKLDIDLWDYLK